MESLTEMMRDLANRGATPEDVYRAAEAQGGGHIGSIRIIRDVFHLSLPDAKEVMLRATGQANSLDEHQQRIADMLLENLDEWDQNRK